MSFGFDQLKLDSLFFKENTDHLARNVDLLSNLITYYEHKGFNHSQVDLTARLQIQDIRLERAAISKIETGYREVTDVEVSAIAKALDVPINWLFGKDK